ncbi:hypothetical protein JL49_25050, partial [Pseudoalteromonas luteoviolacea]
IESICKELPIAPTGDVAINLGESVAIRFNANDTDGFVEKVAVSVNGQLLTELTNTPFALNNKPTKAGTYQLSAVAFDDDNVQSKVVRSTIKVTDNVTEPTPEAPSVDLTSPANGSSFDKGQRITLTVNASDKDLKQVAYFINGKQVTVSTSAPYTATYKVQAEGNYTVHAVATDAKGLSTQCKTHQFSIKDATKTYAAPTWNANAVYAAGKQA